MLLLKRLFFCIAMLTFSGCMQTPLITGQVRADLASDDVVVYYIERPQCNFETVAWLRADGGFFSLDSLVRNMRRQAAKVGASGLYVLHTHRSELKDYRGTAKAIRCLIG